MTDVLRGGGLVLALVAQQVAVVRVQVPHRADAGTRFLGCRNRLDEICAGLVRGVALPGDGGPGAGCCWRPASERPQH